MWFKIDKIFLSKEFQIEETKNIDNDNTEVIVKFKNGDYYSASFYAYSSVKRIQKVHFKNKEFLNGKYFWQKNMVLVKDCSRESIELIVKELINKGDFKTVFNNF